MANKAGQRGQCEISQMPADAGEYPAHRNPETAEGDLADSNTGQSPFGPAWRRPLRVGFG